MHNLWMDEKTIIANWMLRVLDATGWSPPEWARRAGGMAPTTITRLLRDPQMASAPRTDTLAKLIRAVPDDLAIPPPNLDGAPTYGLSDAHSRPPNIPAGLEGATIPEVDVRGGMGGGGVYATEYNRTDEFGNTVAADNIKAVWAFPTSYIHDELRIHPASTWLMEVRGDSMSPTLESGDRVMVDTRDTLPSPGGVFALFDGLGVVVKRLHYVTNSDPAMVRVISDNPRHGEERHPLDDIRIIGRVIWFGRKL